MGLHLPFRLLPDHLRRIASAVFLSAGVVLAACGSGSGARVAEQPGPSTSSLIRIANQPMTAWPPRFNGTTTRSTAADAIVAYKTQYAQERWFFKPLFADAIGQREVILMLVHNLRVDASPADQLVIALEDPPESPSWQFLGYGANLNARGVMVQVTWPTGNDQPSNDLFFVASPAVDSIVLDGKHYQLNDGAHVELDRPNTLPGIAVLLVRGNKVGTTGLLSVRLNVPNSNVAQGGVGSTGPGAGHSGASCAAPPCQP